MEKFRRRRVHSRVFSSTNVTTIVARSSEDSLITAPATEDRGIRKRNTLPELGPDSGSCSSGASAEIELLTFDRGRISSRLSPGTPMKKLLADEMSKDIELKRRSPSVIARLMGLDGMPSQQSGNKHWNRNPKDWEQDAGFAGFCQIGKLCDHQPHRRSLKGQQQIRYVYEAVESSNMETGNNSPPVPLRQNPCEDEVAYIRQHFSTDEKLQNSKVLDSNKDILLKFLQEPDSMFSRHLHKLRGASDSHCKRVQKMKSMNTLKCNIDAIERQSYRESSPKIDVSHSHNHWDSCYDDLCCKCNKDSPKLNVLEKGEEDANSIPTRIVVLKPNLDKVQNTAKFFFPPSPSHIQASDSDLHSECSNTVDARSKMRGEGGKNNGFDIYQGRSQDSRELARAITQRMRNNLGIDSFNVSSSLHKGYSADESGHDMSENDSSYDSEATNVNPQISSNRSIRYKVPASRYAESPVNMEAKRRLSERWKMTQRSSLVGASDKGSTLAEMLANPDVDIRLRSPDGVVGQDECFRRFENSARTAQLMCPLGISSRDGWKDVYIQNLSRSRSLPASSNHLGSLKSNTRPEVLDAERFLVRKESVGLLTNGANNKLSKRKEAFISGSEKSSDRKLKSRYPATKKRIKNVQEVQSRRDMMTKNLDGKDSFELKPIILEMSSCTHDTSLESRVVVDQGCIYAPESQHCPDPNALALEESSTISDARGSSCLQDAVNQPESPVSSKESDQPSPVSVLETPFIEELSSGSECFERVGAELHGLKMQLRLLKQESETYDEGLILISSDEDVELSSELHDSKGFLRVGDGWESSYMVDVLTESMLNRTDPELFLATWYFPHCPIGPWVFEKLEKKYCSWETCLRSERRLLFDSINSGVIEISEQFLNLNPGVQQRGRNVAAQWWKDGWFETELHKILENYKKQMMRVATDAIILDGMRWLELGDHVDSIGKDIEGLLVDELTAELLPV